MTQHVLVVDDEPDLEQLVRQRFRRQIRDGALAFTFAHDGADALEKIAADRSIDMVLTDINMPRMDGLALLGRLQEMEDRLSTVIVSAYGDIANIRTAMNRGAFDFLTKPIDFADLEATIHKTLQTIEITRGLQRRQWEAERARAQLSRYFSPSLAQRLAKDGGEVDLGVQRRDLTAMFTDIQGFTSFAESVEPAILADVLNTYLGEMTTLVFAHGGTLMKLIGDALVVVFGAPEDLEDHAARAVDCALALDSCSQALRAGWQARGIEVGVTRIGLHSGPALVGSFGSGQIFDYTAYGDTINTASRLESANKQLGTRVCVSGAVAERIAGFRGRKVGHVVLRGRSDALLALEPLTEERHTLPLTAQYNAAYDSAQANSPAAIAQFAALFGQDASDGLVSFHLKRLLAGQNGVSVVLE